MAPAMGPRLRAATAQLLCLRHSALQRCEYATVAAVAPAPSIEPAPAAIQRYMPKQPPSYRQPDDRKSQLLRQYTSLIRSTPLTIFFQHNNLKASEWAAIRRELAAALQKTATTNPPTALESTPDAANLVRLQVLRTNIFAVALRIVEFYEPSNPSTTANDSSTTTQQDPTTPIHAIDQATTLANHALSRAAHDATLAPSALRHRERYPRKYDPNPRSHFKRNTPLHPLLMGPVAALTFPAVAPELLATALSILAPTTGSGSAFPAPRRKSTPGYYEPAVQSGLQKLLLLGARVEGRALDGEGVKWVGGLAAVGGLEGLRARLVQMLQGVGAGVTGVLGAASSSLYVTMESRRIAMEDGEGGGDKGVSAASEPVNDTGN